MLPNQILESVTGEFEKLMRDPRVQLDSLNMEIAYTNSMISLLMGRLNSLEQLRRELIGEVLK